MDSLQDLYTSLVYRQVAYDYSVGKQQDSWANSDILVHLPVLRYYASRCNSVVEFGVRGGQSTVALAAGLVSQAMMRSLHSFDVARTPFVDKFEPVAKDRLLWRFQELDTVNESTAKTVPWADMFFFDTLHTDKQIRAELRLHGHKARKYMAFHDTETCGALDLSGPNPAAKGILAGIQEYAIEHRWFELYRSNDCNG